MAGTLLIQKCWFRVLLCADKYILSFWNIYLYKLLRPFCFVLFFFAQNGNSLWKFLNLLLQKDEWRILVGHWGRHSRDEVTPSSKKIQACSLSCYWVLDELVIYAIYPLAWRHQSVSYSSVSHKKKNPLINKNNTITTWWKHFWPISRLVCSNQYCLSSSGKTEAVIVGHAYYFMV